MKMLKTNGVVLVCLAGCGFKIPPDHGMSPANVKILNAMKNGKKVKVS